MELTPAQFERHRPSVPRQRGNVSLDHLTVLNRQVEAARLLGLSQPDVSRLLRGSFREYSMERLLSFRSRQARFQAEWPNGSQPGDKPGLHRLRVTSCRTSCPRSVGMFLTALRSCGTSCSRSDGTFLTVLRSCGTSCLRSDGTFLTALRSCGTSCPRSDGTFLTSLRSCGMSCPRSDGTFLRLRYYNSGT